MSRNKSILLQVAFKEAASSPATESVADVEALTIQYYETLIALHDSLNISLQDTTRPRGGGGGQREQRGPSGTTLEGQAFEVDGVTWRDFRAAKIEGRVKSNFPDFKSASGESVWLYDKQGNVNAEAKALMVAADLVAAL